MGAVLGKILVVDDEPQVCSAISCRLVAHGLDCQTTSDPQVARELLATGQFDVLITDVAMRRISGLELLVCAKQHSPGCKVILITGKSNREVLAQVLMLGAYEYLEKPLSVDAMLMARSHKNSYPVEKMLNELRRCSSTQFHPQIAAAALEWCDGHPKELVLPAQPTEDAEAAWGRTPIVA